MLLNIKGKLRRWNRAAVMGILNLTPDSFHIASRIAPSDVAARAESMLRDGADILDLGGYSTRSGAGEVPVDEELSRLLPAIKAIRDRLGDHAIISIDTFRSDVARRCVEAGADIINDVSGGTLDPQMYCTIADLNIPYVLMHMRGNPATMQKLNQYADVTAEVLSDLAFKADALRSLGVADVIVDPGFGFAKSVDQNYRLLAQLRSFREIGCPVLAGISRKTMIWKELAITPADALNGTTALNMVALVNGADILRVHDVKEAVQTVMLYEAYRRNLPKEVNEISVTEKGEGLQPTKIF